MNAFPFSHCLSCFNLRSNIYLPTKTSSWKTSSIELPLPKRTKRRVACRATTETEPDSSNEKEKEDVIDGTSLPSVDGLGQTNNGLPNSKSAIGQNTDETPSTQPLDLRDSLKKIDGILKPPRDIQEKDNGMEVASGSPLPGMKEKDDDTEVASGSPLPGNRNEATW